MHTGIGCWTRWGVGQGQWGRRGTGNIGGPLASPLRCVRLQLGSRREIDSRASCVQRRHQPPRGVPIPCPVESRSRNSGVTVPKRRPSGSCMTGSICSVCG
ncbi:hypothetical protein K466DRAFT_253500 [Polyporus arcularius HHB13444]|uniref:Uncharacterized protein n=1 Tax=Polyporus arcularius HHB13444 TaxID=1314778 RepID=A0A5C3P329_9APHY|nr:hypothetical protein K466DRAFT_253500 [Polyporus arcularius HHB13444]